LLLNKYPVDTHEQVKQASTYFEEYWKDFSPEERREYCTGLEKRAKEILAPVSTKIADWTGEDYGDRVENFIEQRKRLVPEEEKSTLDMLLQKKAFVEAPTFAEALKEFDLVNGLENQWDRIGDPYLATFSKTAKAEKFWYYETDDGRIYERDLKLLARATQRLQEQFGKEFTNKFMSNPKTVFNEASENTKKVLVTMCLSVYNRS